jgi:hypothetical protein
MYLRIENVGAMHVLYENNSLPRPPAAEWLDRQWAELALCLFWYSL